MESNNRKSRDQKFFEYFIILQKEYIVAELRKKIYPDLSGKSKSEEIMEGKKKKIFDIAFKNQIKTIFPDMKVGVTSLYDEELRIKLYQEIYGNSFPNFIYRDEHQKSLLAEKDKKCYYSIGSEFKSGDLIGILIEVDLEKEICTIQLEDSKCLCNLEIVSRIL